MTPEGKIAFFRDGVVQVERDAVPAAEKCIEYLSKLDEWCLIIGAIHEGHEEARRSESANESP